MSDLTLDRLQSVNWARAEAWHKGVEWTLSDWMTALTGEIGEAANVIKKLNRIRDGMTGNKPHETFDSLCIDLAKELADCQIYLALLATAAGINLGHATIAKFNETSERLSWPERL
jgi:NTP pyrophosphatase (non-canonical NTP hydrolase)